MKKLTPMKAIRAKCIECSGGSAYEVRLCPIKKCPLYPYRSGHRPKVDTLSTEGLETPKPPCSYGVNENPSVLGEGDNS